MMITIRAVTVYTSHICNKKNKTKNITVWRVCTLSWFECMWNIYRVIFSNINNLYFSIWSCFVSGFVFSNEYMSLSMLRRKCLMLTLKKKKENKTKQKSDLSPAARYCDLQLDLDRISTSNLIWNLMWILLFEPAQPGILVLNHARTESYTPVYKSFIFSRPHCSYRKELWYIECKRIVLGKPWIALFERDWDLCPKSIRKKTELEPDCACCWIHRGEIDEWG